MAVPWLVSPDKGGGIIVIHLATYLTKQAKSEQPNFSHACRKWLTQTKLLG